MLGARLGGRYLGALFFYTETLAPMSNLPAQRDYDCLVLSGGGANGAYGAGVAKALDTYRQRKAVDRPLCYIGTSAGALNAYMLAAKGADELIRFWRTLSNTAILGSDKPPSLPRLIRRITSCGFRNVPFSMYDNTALRRLMETNADLSDLKSPLIVAVTDYTSGGLRAFYHGDIIDRVVAEDAKAAERARRLKHLRRIDDTGTLIDALLASAAIPVFFPPVDIQVVHAGVTEASAFVDGGVGNNTPTREAAYFSRYLEALGEGTVNTVFCVTQDPPRIFQHGTGPRGLLEIVQRTLDVFQYVHTAPIVDAWTRINREVESHRKKIDEIATWLDTAPLLPKTRDEVKAQLEAAFGGLGGRTARVTKPLVKIGPTSDLGDFLDFSPTLSEKRITAGYVDGLRAIRATADPDQPDETLIDETELQLLLNRPIWQD